MRNCALQVRNPDPPGAEPAPTEVAAARLTPLSCGVEIIRVKSLPESEDNSAFPCVSWYFLAWGRI